MATKVSGHPTKVSPISVEILHVGDKSVWSEVSSYVSDEVQHGTTIALTEAMEKHFNGIEARCVHESLALKRAEKYMENGDFQTAIFILTFQIPCEQCDPMKMKLIEKLKEKMK